MAATERIEPHAPSYGAGTRALSEGTGLRTGKRAAISPYGTPNGTSIPIHTACDIGLSLATRILKDAGFTADDYLRLR